VDNQTKTLVITRNNPAPVMIANNEDISILDETSLPIGLYRGTRPVINELGLEVGLTTVVYTDGIVHAGSRYGESIDIVTCLKALLEDEDPSPQLIADSLLENAIHLDRGRPADDISVVVLRVMGRTDDKARRMTVRLPLDLV
jgi:serine phosphatase RsbU (regulator of sigma subunit)